VKAIRAGLVVVLVHVLVLFWASPQADASRGPVGETVHIAVTGTDDAIWSTPGRNSGWTSVGGVSLTTPGVGLLQTSPTAFDPLYVTVGDDAGLWVRTSGGGWRPLSQNDTFCIDQPGVYTEGDKDATGWFTRVWVACVGEDESVWFASGVTRGNAVPVLNNWTPLGGEAAAGVSVARVAGAITFLVNGTDTPEGTSVYIRTTTNGWSKTPWGCFGTPALGAAYGKAWMACVGLDDALWFAKNFGPSWSTPQRAGGLVTGPPGVAVTSSGATFEVRGDDEAVWENFAGNTAAPLGWSTTGGLVPDLGEDVPGGVAAVGTTPTP
jgi:hypothetical protein